MTAIDSTPALTVSVIMPAFNAQEFIDSALSSVLKQTLASLEVIVIDDGSTDATATMVENVARKDPRVRLIRRLQCGGVSAARNAGLDAARGRFIALIDADDGWAENRLEVMVAALEAEKLDAVADQQECIESGTGNALGAALRASWMNAPQTLSLSEFLLMDWPGRKDTLNIGILKPVIRRSFIESSGVRYAVDQSLGEDLLFYASLLMAGMRMRLIPDSLYHYTVRTDSLSRYTKPTTGQVEANRLIAAGLKKAKLAQRHREKVFTILKMREKALWLQYLLWALKLRQFRMLAANFWRAGMTVPLLWIGDVVRRRISGLSHDWDPTIVSRLQQRS